MITQTYFYTHELTFRIKTTDMQYIQSIKLYLINTCHPKKEATLSEFRLGAQSYNGHNKNQSFC